MKSCPTCNRTFEDSFTFCLVDGAILSPPYDPQATQHIPEVRITNSPPTEIFPSNVASNAQHLPSTIVSPQLQPTQAYVPPELPLPSTRRAVDTVSVNNETPVGRIIAGFSVGVVFGVIIGISRTDPRDAIPLAIFLGLVGAIVGKFFSSVVRMFQNSKNN